MKYLESYYSENVSKELQQTYKKNSYWMLPTDRDRYAKSLEQIGCTNMSLYETDLIYHGNSKYDIYVREHKYILISFRVSSQDWSWMPYDNKNYYEMYGFKYMGEVNISEEEKDADKYNL